MSNKSFDKIKFMCGNKSLDVWYIDKWTLYRDGNNNNHNTRIKLIQVSRIWLVFVFQFVIITQIANDDRYVITIILFFFFYFHFPSSSIAAPIAEWWLMHFNIASTSRWSTERWIAMRTMESNTKCSNHFTIGHFIIERTKHIFTCKRWCVRNVS